MRGTGETRRRSCWRGHRRAVLVILAVTVGATGCAPSGDGAPDSPSGTSGSPGASTSASPTVTTTPTDRPGGATAAPSWLGTRVLPRARNGFGVVRATPRQLRNRRIITVDELPPPPDGGFHATVTAVPEQVLDRSTWSPRCPADRDDLRYVRVSFRGFDGLAHTGELIVHRRAATTAVRVFRRLFRVGFPIERMRVTSVAELDAPPTGDGNTTAAFVCRPVVGAGSWSRHAYGLAVDVNPFQNPYTAGDVVLPELASAYTDRQWRRPGMILAGGPVAEAFEREGWTWGGTFRNRRDPMHFSLGGG